MRKLNDYEIEKFRSVLIGLDILTNYESNQETINDLVHKYVKSITEQSLKYQSTKRNQIDSINKTRNNILRLLNMIDEGFENSLKWVEEIYGKFDKLKKFKESHPEFMNPYDPPEVIKHFEKFKEKEYNFKGTSEIIGCCYQSVSNKVKKGELTPKKCGSTKIKIDDIYKYYLTDYLKKNKLL